MKSVGKESKEAREVHRNDGVVSHWTPWDQLHNGGRQAPGKQSLDKKEKGKNSDNQEKIQCEGKLREALSFDV